VAWSSANGEVSMNLKTNHTSDEETRKLWMKRMAWALPLFFLLKGLMWLAVPALLIVLSQ
jgi:hypothetical protein